MAITIQELLQIAVENDASDLHITTHIPPRIRVNGILLSIDHPPLSPAETKNLVYSLLTDRQKKMFEEELKTDNVEAELKDVIFIISLPKVQPKPEQKTKKVHIK